MYAGALPSNFEKRIFTVVSFYTRAYVTMLPTWNRKYNNIKVDELRILSSFLSTYAVFDVNNNFWMKQTSGRHIRFDF